MTRRPQHREGILGFFQDIAIALLKGLGRTIIVILGASLAGAIVGGISMLFSETPSEFWVGAIIGGVAGFALSVILLFALATRDTW